MDNLNQTAEIDFFNHYTIKNDTSITDSDFRFRFLSSAIVSFTCAVTTAGFISMLFSGWIIILAALFGAVIGLAFMSSCWISGASQNFNN